jgi:hypothetical protein
MNEKKCKSTAFALLHKIIPKDITISILFKPAGYHGKNYLMVPR